MEAATGLGSYHVWQAARGARLQFPARSILPHVPGLPFMAADVPGLPCVAANGARPGVAVAPAAPAAPAAAPAVASDAPMANGETCEAGGGGGVLATVDPRFKKLSPMAGEAAEVLGIPRDATWDQALHMLAPQMEGVTAEQMKAALEELTIGMSDDFEDWT